MLHQAVHSHLFKLGALSAIVAVRVNGNAPSGSKLTPHLNVLGVHKLDKVLHNDINAVLVEIAVITEAVQIKFQRL